MRVPKKQTDENAELNAKFNMLFTSSLLKTCGEPTIAIGHICDERNNRIGFLYGRSNM